MDDNRRHTGRRAYRRNGNRTSGRRIGGYINSLRDGREAGCVRDTAHLSIRTC